jgi:hypothetical protein
MPRLEQTISPIIRGAGRSLDMSYPAPQIQVEGNNAIGIEWTNRQAYTIWDMGTVTGFGAPPAGSGWKMYKGRIAHRQTGDGVSGGFYLTGSNFTITFGQNKSGAGAYADDFRCWRVTLIAAFDGGVGTGDTGLEIGPALNYDIRTGTPPGFRLGPGSAANTLLQIRRNGGGAFTVDQQVAALDVTEWHMYEMRFIGATDKNDAIFRAFVDGAQVASFSWGAGTLLPFFANGSSFGYMIGVGNRGTSGVYTAMNGLSVQAAPTEAALL